MDEQSTINRLMALDPELTLAEAADALSKGGVPRMTARCEDQDGTLLAGVVFMRGSSAETYIAALDAMDEDGTLLGRVEALQAELEDARQEAGELHSLARQRQEKIEEQAREIRDLQYEVGTWRGA